MNVKHKVIPSVLPLDFYLREDVVLLARELLGKVLFTNFDDKITAGIITETEAYEGVTDRASHAWSGKISPRTRVMYEEGGVAYIYLCYGIHSLFNVVTNRKGIPHAVLVRSLFPFTGLEHMHERLGRRDPEATTLRGPGKLSRAMGIHYSASGLSLLGDRIWIEDHGMPTGKIESGKRIGVDYAGEHAAWPYRFIAHGDQNQYKQGRKMG